MFLRDTLCSIDGCEKPYKASGLCGMHYMRKYSHGTFESLHRTKCSIENCNRKHCGKGYCSIHYTRWKKYGDPTYLIRDGGNGNTPEEKFWSKVDKTPGLGRDGNCWEWMGKSVVKFGYGVVRRNYKQMPAHHLAWFYTKGYKPSKSLLHSCDNPKCVRVSHLREGTQQENIDDMYARNRFARGKAVNKNAISEDVVRRIRILLAQGFSRQQIMDIEEVSYRPVRDIDTGRNWKWLT